VARGCPRTAAQCSGVFSSASFSLTLSLRPGPWCAKACSSCRSGRAHTTQRRRGWAPAPPRSQHRCAAPLTSLVRGIADGQLALPGVEEHRRPRRRPGAAARRQRSGDGAQNLVAHSFCRAVLVVRRLRRPHLDEHPRLEMCLTATNCSCKNKNVYSAGPQSLGFVLSLPHSHLCSRSRKTKTSAKIDENQIELVSMISWYWALIHLVCTNHSTPTPFLSGLLFHSPRGWLPVDSDRDPRYVVEREPGGFGA